MECPVQYPQANTGETTCFVCAFAKQISADSLLYDCRHRRQTCGSAPDDYAHLNINAMHTIVPATPDRPSSIDDGRFRRRSASAGNLVASSCDENVSPDTAGVGLVCMCSLLRVPLLFCTQDSELYVRERADAFDLHTAEELRNPSQGQSQSEVGPDWLSRGSDEFRALFRNRMPQVGSAPL